MTLSTFELTYRAIGSILISGMAGYGIFQTIFLSTGELIASLIWGSIFTVVILGVIISGAFSLTK